LNERRDSTAMPVPFAKYSLAVACPTSESNLGKRRTKEKSLGNFDFTEWRALRILSKLPCGAWKEKAVRLAGSLFLMLGLALNLLHAAGPADNLPDKVRPVPPPGIAVPPADRTELEAGVSELGKEIEALRTALQAEPALLDLLPDVEIYHKA